MTAADRERLARLEVEFSRIKETQAEINQKLDDLIALRNKGAGVFWLASVLFGTTLVGVIGTIIAWVKG